MALQVGFGWRTTGHARVGVDEGQILTLLGCEAWSRRRLTHTARLIHGDLGRGGRHEHTLPGRVERGRAWRASSHAQRRQARRSQAQASPDPAGSRCRTDGRDHRHQPRRGRLDRLPHQASLCGGWLGTGAKRGAAPGCNAQAHRQGGSAARGHRVRQPARGACPLDLGAAGRREMVRLTEHSSLSRETVRRRLAENALKPWRQKMWCIPRVSGEFVARMEDVLDLYAEAPDPKRPVVCFDESPTQLIGETRRPIPPKPGQVERFDYEYRRAGTVNLFVLVDAHRPWRKITVTQQRTALDFARCMRELVQVDYSQAERIRVVLDNLSAHTPGALYDTFPAEEAHRLLRW